MTSQMASATEINSTGATAGYASSFAIVLCWFDGALMTHDWHISIEVSLAITALLTPLFHMLFVRKGVDDPYTPEDEARRDAAIATVKPADPSTL